MSSGNMESIENMANTTKKSETLEPMEIAMEDSSTVTAKFPGMVRTLKTLLDATTRERLRLETLLDEAKEVSERLETLLDRSDQTFESRPRESRDTGKLVGGFENRRDDSEENAPLLARREPRGFGGHRENSDNRESREPSSWRQASAGQVESLRARLAAFRQESKLANESTESTVRVTIGTAIETTSERTTPAEMGARSKSGTGTGTNMETNTGTNTGTETNIATGASRNERMRKVDTLLRQGATTLEIAAHCRLPIGEVELMSRLLQPHF